MRYLLLSLIVMTVMSSCGDTTTVGSDLIEDDKINIVHRDDFNLSAKTVKTDPIYTFTPSLDIVRLYSGSATDPVFGQIESKFFFQMRYANSLSPNYDGAILDSMVLTLDVLPDESFGDTSTTYDIEIYRLLTDINVDSIRSDADFTTSSKPVASIKGVNPKKLDSIKVSEPSGTSTTFTNVIRVPLSQSFSQELFDNRDVFGSQDKLTKVFNGFMLKAKNNGSGLISFFMGNGNAVRNNYIRAYYKTVVDTTINYRTNNYQLGYIKPMVYTNDLSGTIVEPKIDQPITGDDVGYVQGFNGPVVELDLADALSLNDQKAQLNHATLEMTVAYDQFINTKIQPARILGLYYKDSKGELYPVEDLALGLRRNNRETVFGGNREEPERDFFKYTMTITAHLKAILEGQYSSKVYISVLDREQNPNRTILYGPQHSQYPMKLNATFTKP